MNKLELLQHLSGVGGVSEVGSSIEVDDATAIRYINKGIAKAETVKAHNALMKKAEKLKSEKAEAEAKANAILKQSVIQNELNELYLSVVEKEAELNGEVLSDEEKLEAVESISKRDALANKKASGD